MPYFFRTRIEHAGGEFREYLTYFALEMTMVPPISRES
jgi:hypothetical protein